MSAARLATEFIGTFFLVLIITLVVTAATPSPLAPLVIGLALMAMVYMGGHISGAHYNPAVSLALLMRGKLLPREMLAYWAAQVAGAIAAAGLGYLMVGHTAVLAPGAQVGLRPALLAELVFAFALVLVVLNVAASETTKGNSYYGLAIGMTVTVGAVAVGGMSGGAFNPAVGIGLVLANAFLGGGAWSHVWIYLVGPFAGAALAALVFGLQEQVGG